MCWLKAISAIVKSPTRQLLNNVDNRLGQSQRMWLLYNWRCNLLQSISNISLIFVINLDYDRE